MRELSRSHALWQRAERVIPLGTQTLSKSPTQFVQGVTPIYLERGLGAHVWDVDGNEFVDYPMALGPVLLGYAEPAVNEAIERQLRDGITFSLMHPLEVEVAERIVGCCPGVEAVRFGKSGSDAVTAAVRAARAYTGRDRIVVTGYHGWHDWYIGSTTRSAGVPAAVARLTTAIPFDDLDALVEVFNQYPGEIAAVVLEPSSATVPSAGYLARLVELSHERGALVIFDEVITGFRLAAGGARERYGVIPDFSCYGKALANGMPLSAVAGAWQHMGVFKEVFFSGTHGGETLSLAAARAVLDAIADGVVLTQIRSRGARLQESLSSAVQHHGLTHRVTVTGEPQRCVVGFVGSEPLIDRSFVQQSFAEDGILFNGSMFICGRHTDDDVDRAARCFDRSLSTMSAVGDVRELLNGPPVQPVFRKP
jgi:glutamate-1-semialdehyde 2,1-aminomutase/spore coat polysaccharide biosynthesis protein SpsF